MRRAEYTHDEQGACCHLRPLTREGLPWRGAWLDFESETPRRGYLVVEEGSPEWPEGGYPDKLALSTPVYRDKREAELNRPALEDRVAKIERHLGIA